MKFLTGSKYFFGNCEGYEPTITDTDYIEIIENADFRRIRLIHDENGFEVYQWALRPKAQIFEEFEHFPNSTAVCSLLVPEFNEVFGITYLDLIKVENVINNLTGKLSYYKVIYDAYMKNGSFVLTDEQRQAAYEVYKKNKKPSHRQYPIVNMNEEEPE